jgi:hypothetical protein
VECDVIPQIIGSTEAPSTSVTSALKLAGSQPIISLEDMVYPNTYYHHIVGDILLDETSIQKWVQEMKC